MGRNTNRGRTLDSIAMRRKQKTWRFGLRSGDSDYGTSENKQGCYVLEVIKTINFVFGGLPEKEAKQGINQSEVVQVLVVNTCE